MSVDFAGSATPTPPTNRFMAAELDLTVSHTDQSLGLSVLGVTYRWLTVDQVDAPATYRLLQTDGSMSSSLQAKASAKFQEHEFVDILVSNPAGSGIIRFIVGWRSD